MDLRSRCIILVIFFALSLLIIACVLLSILPSFVRRGVLEAVSLKNNSDAAELWSSPPYEMKLEIWLFNITNPNEIIYRQAKPVLRQVGPYAFNQYQEKVDVQFHLNNTVSYRNFKRYEFNSSLSCNNCKLTDELLVPSIPFWTLLHKLRQMGGLPKLKKFISYGLLGLGEEPFVTKSVDELLFKGYDDILFSMAKSLKWLSPDTELPERMGFLYGKNYSYEGPFLIKTGVDDVSYRGVIELFKGKSNVSCWSTASCNMINGSDGTVFPPFLERTSRLNVFSPDLFRSLYMEYVNDVKVDQFQAYRYSVPRKVFSSSAVENAGYCWPTDVYYPSGQVAHADTGLACLPTGLLNVSKCQAGAPVVISSPHFLYADDEVQASVEGLAPSVEAHATFVDVEPVSSVGLSFQRKLQINVAMVRDNDFATIKRMRSVIVPVLWVKESANLNAEEKANLWSRLFVPQSVVSGTAYLLICLGVVVLIVGILLHINQRRLRKEDVV